MGTSDALLLASWISLPDVRDNANGLNVLGNPIGDEGLKAILAMVDGYSIENLSANLSAPCYCVLCLNLCADTCDRLSSSCLGSTDPAAPIGTRISSVCGILRGQDDVNWANRDLSVSDCSTIAADIKYSIEYGNFVSAHTCMIRSKHYHLDLISS
jgi:hypothetical protein